jgi:hypothetical protein
VRNTVKLEEFMTSYLKKTLILTALLATTACGGGGGSDDPVVVDPSPGTNGLPSGVTGQDLSDAEGTEMTLAAAGYENGSGASVTQGGTVTLATNFLTGGPSNLDATISMFGEEVTITNGIGTLLNGNIVTLEYDPSSNGTYAGAFSAANHDAGTYVGETAYVFGFETDPAKMQTSGTVEYSGGFLANGLAGGSEVAYEGTITIDVNFAGSATGTLDGVLDGSTDLDLDLDNGALSGNGITANLNCDTSCSTSTSTLDGTFYGPNAEELGGVLAIDTNVFEGAGTFVITVTGS